MQHFIPSFPKAFTGFGCKSQPVDFRYYGKGSSHPSRCQSYCSRFFGGQTSSCIIFSCTIAGGTSPSGSYGDMVGPTRPLLLNFLSLWTVFSRKVSFTVLHRRPRGCVGCMGESSELSVRASAETKFIIGLRGLESGK